MIILSIRHTIAMTLKKRLKKKIRLKKARRLIRLRKLNKLI